MVLALVIVACILCFIAAFGVPAGRVNLFALGVAIWILSTIWNSL